jgi:senataxin
VREVFEGSDIVCTTLAGASQLPNAYQRADAGWLTCLCDGANTNAAAGAVDGAGGGGRRGVAGALAAAMTFDAVIVDEAGQAVEPEALTPLRLSVMGHVNASRGFRGRSTSGSAPNGDYCKRLVLVGDPLQLPATVLSRNAAMAGLDVSLFERLAAAGVKPMLLRTQYRMHGEIAKFSSMHFYRGLVRDSPSLSTTSLQRTLSFQNQQRLDICLHPLSLINVPLGRETRQGEEDIWGNSGPAQAADPSYGNTDEAVIAVAHAIHLIELISRGNSLQSGGTATRGLIGIISPYKEQVRRIKNLLQRASAASVDINSGISGVSSILLRSVIVSSVDSFQGQELDHIIITTVRSSSSSSSTSGHNQSGIGFLSDKRRLNVAVTRARLSLTLVCNADHLSRFDEDWRVLISHMIAVGGEEKNCDSLQSHRLFVASLLNK